MNFSIEKAFRADYDELTELWEASVRATHTFLAEEDILRMRPQLRAQWLDAVDLFCIRTPEGVIAAFMGISDAFLEMLFVRPDCRGKGFGRRLLGYAVEQFGVTDVDVNEQNGQAVGFYLHEGFVVNGRSERDAQGQPFPLLHLKINQHANNDK